MRQLTYDIFNGQFVNKELKPVWTVFINCKEAIIFGTHTRRMYDELKECYRDVEAFYIRYAGNEYGMLDMKLSDFLQLCKSGPVCRPSGQDDCDPEQIFECQFEEIFE